MRRFCWCGQPAQRQGECWACYSYRREHGKPRPRWMAGVLENCQNKHCRFPLHLGHSVRGYCGPCYQYRRRHGIARPPELTGGNRWCDCGQPARHKLQIMVGGSLTKNTIKEELELCDRCYRLEAQAVA